VANIADDWIQDSGRKPSESAKKKQPPIPGGCRLCHRFEWENTERAAPHATRHRE
jgi:hypothetical protein